MIQLDKVSKSLAYLNSKTSALVCLRAISAELRAETVQEKQHCYICFRGCISLTAER